MSATPAKRACDACHRRKVRCNGSNPCQNCIQASLACTYNKPPQKKGPKGSRAKVISELRKSQEQSNSVASASGPYSPLSALGSPNFPRVELLPLDLVEASINGFFDTLYPTLPIINQSWIQQKALELHSNLESYCLVGSLCAFMVIQPNVQAPNPQSPLSSGLGNSYISLTPQKQAQTYGLRLIEEVKRARGSIDYGENPSTATVVTAFLISAACFGLEKHTTAWFHLQEAILFARMIRIHDEKAYQANPSPVDTMNRRLFWILYVSERAQALQKHRDLTFHETIAFPVPESNPLEHVAIPGLSCLFNLFRVVDDRISEIWNSLRAETPVVWPPNTQMWLTQLQQQLSAAIPEGIQLTEVQEVDIKITQLWLRTVLWQLTLASGCLSSTSEEESMNFHYPVELGREVVSLTTRVQLASMEAHGIGLVEKLFDIAYTLIDVIVIIPMDTPLQFQSPPSPGRAHLSHILWLITTLRGGETRYATLLHAKIREALPELAASMGIVTPTGRLRDDMSSSDAGTTRSVDSSPFGSPGSQAAVHASLPGGLGSGGGGVSLGGAGISQLPQHMSALGGRWSIVPPIVHGPGSMPGSAPDSPIGGMSPVPGGMSPVATGMMGMGVAPVTSAGASQGYTSGPRF